MADNRGVTPALAVLFALLMMTSAPVMGGAPVIVADTADHSVAGENTPADVSASEIGDLQSDDSVQSALSPILAQEEEPPASAGRSLQTGGLGYGTIEDGDPIEFATDDRLTVEFWVKPDADSDEDAWIMRQGDSWGVQWTGTGEERQIYFQADGFNDGITSNSGVSAGVWTHVAIVYDGNNRIIYLNGEEDKTLSGADSPGTNDNRVRFGSNDGANGQFFVGQIDNVRFWDTDRSLIEVQNDRFVELDGSESGLDQLYQFDSNEPTDLAGNSDITLTGDAEIVDGDSNPVAPYIHAQPQNGSTAINLAPRTGPAGENDADEFRLYRSTSPDSDTASLVTTLQPSETSYTDQDVSNGGTYFYWTTAVDGDGEGDFSKAASVSPYGKTEDTDEQGATPIGGQGSNSVELDGRSWATLSDRASIDRAITPGDNEFAIEFWVKPDADSDEDAWIMRKQNSWGVKWVGTGEERKINFQADGFNTGITSNGGVQAGVWTHVAIVYDGNNRNVYLNGELDKSGGDPDGPGATGSDLVIGSNGANNGQFFVGEIDDLRFWDTPRSSSQIENNYTEELVGTETGLVGYWQFDTSEDGDATTRGSTYRHGEIKLNSDATISEGGAYPLGTDTHVHSRNDNATVTWVLRTDTTPEEFAVWRKDAVADEAGWNLIERIENSSQRTYVDESASNGQNYHYAVTATEDGQESDFPRSSPARPYEDSGGTALSLDGSQDTRGLVTDRPSLGVISGDEFAIEFWVKPDADSDEDAWIMRKQNSWGVKWVGTGEERKINFQADGFNDGITSNGGVQAGVWTHVAIVYDGNNRNVYLNGKLDKRSSGADGPGTSDSDLSVGVNDAGNEGFFVGQIDEIALWETERTSDQIEVAYNDRLTGNETGLRHYWQFDEQGADASRATTRRHATIDVQGSAVVESPGAMPVTPRVYARADDQSTTVSWRVRNLAETTDVGIYRSTQRDLGDRTEIAVTEAVTDSRYTDPGLTNGQTRFYQATAFNTDGQESDYAFEAGALPSEQIGGNAFRLLGNESTSYGTLTDRPSIDRAIGDEFAIEFWVNPDAGSEENAWIIRKQDAWGVQWSGTGQQRPIYFQADGFNDGITSDSNIQADTWTHVAIVYDGNNRNIYLNGQLDTSRSGADGPGTSGKDVRIGTNDARNDRYFEGSLDELRIWENPRSDDEIARNYENELAGSEDALVGYWRGPYTTDDDSVTGNARKPMTLGLNNVDTTDSDIPINPGGVDTTTVNVNLECAPDGLTYYQIRLNATSGESIRSIEGGSEFGEDSVFILDGGPGVSSVTAAGEFVSSETVFQESRILFSVEYEGAVEQDNVDLTVESLRGGDGEITSCDVSTDVGEPQSPSDGTDDGDDTDGGDGDDSLTVDVSSETVGTNGATTVTVSSTGAERLVVSGDTEGWTVTDMSPLASLVGNPTSGDLPYETSAGENWSYGENTLDQLEITLEATVETGTYSFTAQELDTDDNVVAEEDFTIVVSETDYSDWPTDSATASAIDENGDGDISLGEIRTAVAEWQSNGQVNGEDITLSTIRDLVQFWQS